MLCGSGGAGGSGSTWMVVSGIMMVYGLDIVPVMVALLSHSQLPDAVTPLQLVHDATATLSNAAGRVRQLIHYMVYIYIIRIKSVFNRSKDLNTRNEQTHENNGNIK